MPGGRDIQPTRSPDAVVKEMYRAAEAGDIEKVSTLIDDRARFHVGRHGPTGKGHVLGVFRSRSAAFSDLHIDVNIVKASEYETVAEVAWSGRHTGLLSVRIPGFAALEPTGKTVHMGPGRIVYEVRGGKVVSGRRRDEIYEMDRQLLTQLGMNLYPSPPF